MKTFECGQKNDERHLENLPDFREFPKHPPILACHNNDQYHHRFHPSSPIFRRYFSIKIDSLFSPLPGHDQILCPLLTKIQCLNFQSKSMPGFGQHSAQRKRHLPKPPAAPAPGNTWVRFSLPSSWMDLIRVKTAYLPPSLNTLSFIARPLLPGQKRARSAFQFKGISFLSWSYREQYL